MNEQLRNPESGWVTGLPVPYQLRFYSPDELPTEPPGGSETFELRPGSVLYLPRGHWHATETIEDSLSIELSLPTDAWADLVLDGLRTVLYPRQEWREAAVGAWGTERQRARARRCLAGLMADLGEALAQLRPEDLVGPAKPRPPELSARYRRNPTATIGVERARSGGDAHVRFIRKGLRELEETEAQVDRPSLRLSRWILSSRAPFTGEEAAMAEPDLAPDDVLELLGFLLDVGLIREEGPTAR